MVQCGIQPKYISLYYDYDYDYDYDFAVMGWHTW
jgi:hypothetical protein